MKTGLFMAIVSTAALAGSAALAATEYETRMDAHARMNAYTGDVQARLSIDPRTRTNLPARKVHPTDNMAEDLNRLHNPARVPVVRNYGQWENPDLQ